LQRDAIVPVVDMTLRGLKLDIAEHTRQVEEWSRELANARHAYVEITGNPPPQTDNDVRRWLLAVLSPEELDRWKKTASGQLCVDHDRLDILGHIPAARPILAMRAKQRLLNNFGPKLAAQINPATGRLHCHFRIAAAKTGRFASRNPNLQNLPSAKAPEFRQCVIADSDNLLVVADYSQIEIRVAAHNSRDRVLTEILATGGDIHRQSAAMIAGISATEVTKEQRQMAKAVSFGVLYGQQAEGLAASAFVRFGVEMAPAEAQRTLDRFFGAYPDLHRHLQHNFQLCRRRGYVLIQPSGRIIRKEWEGWISYQDACKLANTGRRC
jgi:DNA polymerase I-like protein with 3'-5' exonuclease and polymerase domains